MNLYDMKELLICVILGGSIFAATGFGLHMLFTYPSRKRENEKRRKEMEESKRRFRARYDKFQKEFDENWDTLHPGSRRTKGFDLP